MRQKVIGYGLAFDKRYPKTTEGKWIAVGSDGRIAAVSATSVRKILHEARERGYRKPMVIRVPQGHGTYVL